jgi:NADH-quinone oxidoreductase subunit E
MISAATKVKVEALATAFSRRRSGLLPALHLIQKESGYISPEATAFLARMFELSPAQVFETITFYHMFRTRPAGRYVFQVCTNVSCMLRGSEAIMQTLQEVLGIEPGETTADGQFTLQETECLAACGSAPVVQLNEEYLEHVTCRQIQELLAVLRKES